jgi:acyl-CoA thioesterase-2
MASARADNDKVISSIHGVFGRTVSSDKPVEVEVSELSAGRSYTSVGSSLSQGGVERARALSLLNSPGRHLIHHQASMPRVPGPEQAVPVEDLFGRETRIVGGTDRADPNLELPPVLSLWFRHEQAPTDIVLGQALLAHASASYLIPTAMLPHRGFGESMVHQDISTGILAHTISFHELFDLRDWLLISQESTFTGHGNAYGEGRIFSEDGRLIASFSQESIVRHCGPSHPGIDPSSVL